MNIVFWVLVIIVLSAVWFSFRFAFKQIGAVWLKMFNDVKNEIEEERE